MSTWPTKKEIIYWAVLIAFSIFVALFIVRNSGLALINFWDFLNENSGAVQALTTGALVLVTIIYAVFSGKMASLFSKQTISNIELKVEELTIKNLFDDEHINNIKQCIKQERKFGSMILYFDLKYSAKNHFAGPGTIDKPSLVILHKGQSLFTLTPPEKNYSWGFRVSGGGFSMSAQDALAAKQLATLDNHLQTTIYFRGGERKLYKDSFSISILCGESNLEVLTLVNNRDDIEFCVEYINDRDRLVKIPILKEKIKIEKND